MTLRGWSIVAVIAIVFGLFTPMTEDYVSFYAAGRALLNGVNPYTVHAGYYNPLYVAAAYAPLSLLPFEVSYRVQAGLMLFVYAVALWRIVRRRYLWLITLAAPFALMCALYGNIDGLVILGITLPTPIGLWLVLAKPQIGLVAAAVMLARDYKTHGLRRVLIESAPVAVVYAGSIACGMLATTPVHSAWNMAIWPWGLLIGVPLAVYAVRRLDVRLGLLATVVAAPYLNILSWGAIQPALSRRRSGALLGVAVCWAIWAVWRLGIGR